MIAKKTHPSLVALSAGYNRFASAKSAVAFKAAAVALSKQIDADLKEIRKALGGSATPFSIFRGYFLEEVAIRVASHSTRSITRQGVVVKKLGTGVGVVTGLLIKYRKGPLPEVVPLDLQRDREDVIVGFERRMEIRGNGESVAKFSQQLIPVCTVACKMYVDATRLENVLAKARSFYGQYSKSMFVVLAEWDAFGAKWHDESGAVLDSLYAPAHEILFLREGRRPKNAGLQVESVRRPYRVASLERLEALIGQAVQSWGLPPSE